METTLLIDSINTMEDLKNCKTVDFGTVEPGRMTTKTVLLDPSYKVTKVESSSLQNPLDKTFFLDTDKTLSSTDGKIELIYRPSLPNQNNFDVFYLTFEDNSRLALVVKGRTASTHVTLSPAQVHFKSTENEPTSVFHISITNESQARDYYQWELPNGSYQVNLTPKCGKIRPGERVSVTVTIRPRREGFYYRRIFCLFKFQEPVALEIYGYHSETGHNVDLSRKIVLNETLPRFRTEFCRYVSDCSNPVFPESRPLLVLSQRYIRFGRVNCSQASSSSAKSFTLFNQGLKALTIVWEKDESDVFRIEPRVSVIRSESSSRFVVSFTPRHPFQFYSHDLLASVLWGSELDFLVPSSVVISVAGDSFSEICTWVAPFKIDRTDVVLPATVPHVPVYTTFRVCKTGSLPIFFKLYPSNPLVGPEQSNFVVKPLQGLVTEKFSVIIVQFCPEAKSDVDFNEEWVLCVNASTKVKLKIFATSQLPYVFIGNGKEVQFPLTTVGTWSDLGVPIRNATRLNLTCKWFVDGTENTNELAPGEQSNIPLRFTAGMGPPREFEWAESVQVLWTSGDRSIDRVLEGRSVSARTVVRCRGRSVDASIEGYPDMVTLSNVLLGRARSATFRVRNNGDAVVYLALSVKSRVFGKRKASVDIDPSHLALQPLETGQVRVNVLNQTIGRNNFEIVGRLQQSPTFCQGFGQDITLTMIEVYSSFPTVKVIDIDYQGLIGNLSKFTLWNCFRINQLNDCFKRTHVKNRQVSHMQIPASNQNSPSFRFQLLLQSESAIPLTVRIAPLKSCPCKETSITSMSRRLRVPECRHSNQITGRLSVNHLKPCEKTVLSFEVLYDEPVQEPFKFALTIHPTDEPEALKTVTTLCLTRPVILRGQRRLQLSIPIDADGSFYHWTLEPVYVGDDSKYVQILWLWNESDHDVNYTVEWCSVDAKIFELLNPQGTIDSSRSHPLFLRCTPFEFKNYTAEMMIRCEDTLEVFTVRVQLPAVAEFRYDSRHAMNKMPVLSSFSSRDLLCELSPQHLCLPSMPTHSVTRRIFFLKNHTQDVLLFNWLTLQVWGAFKASVMPSTGYLQPEEIKSLTLQVRSHRFPLKATLDVQCIIFNVSEYYNNAQDIKQMKKLTTTFDTCFTIRSGHRSVEGHFDLPRSGVKRIKKPGAFLISLGVTAHVFNESQLNFLCPRADQQLVLAPQLKADLLNSVTLGDSFKMVVPELPDIAIEVIRKAIGDVLKSSAFKLVTTEAKASPMFYAGMSPSFTQGEPQQRVKLQAHHMGSLMGRAIHFAIASMFDIGEPHYAVENEPLSGKNDLPLNNSYYRDILLEKIEQVCTARF